MKDETRAALSDQTTWMRLPVMLLFFLMLQVATPLLIVVSLVGWLMRLFTGEKPQGVIDFGHTLAKWFSRTTDYLCGGAQRRPFPFEDYDCPSDRAQNLKPAAPAASGKASEAASTAQKSASADKSGTKESSVKPQVPKQASKATSSKASASKKVDKKKVSKKKSAKKKSSKKTSNKKTSNKKTSQTSPQATDSGADAPGDT